MECIAKRHFFLMPIENRVGCRNRSADCERDRWCDFKASAVTLRLRLTSCGDEFSAKATLLVKDLPVLPTSNLSVFNHLTDRSARSTPPHASVESEWRCLD